MEKSQSYLIVGLGTIGRRHVANLRQLRPTARIGALRSRSGTENHIPGIDFTVETIDAALSFRPDAAIIASPATMHIPVARELIAAGVDVLIEKPLSASLEEARAFASDVRETDAVVMVGYSLRFLPSLHLLRDFVMNGRIGNVCYMRVEVGQYLPDWRPGQNYQNSVSAQKELGGGVLLDLSHELDYVCWLLGMPSRLTARGGRFSQLQLDVEDLVELVLEYESPRRLVSIHIDMLDRSAQRHCRACGESGSMTWDAGQNRVCCYDVKSGQWAEVSTADASDRNQMYVNELSHFLDCVSNRRHPDCTVEDGVKVLRLVQAARKSMATGATVHV